MKKLFFNSDRGKRFTLWVLESATEQSNNSLVPEDVDFIEARLWPNRTLKLQWVCKTPNGWKKTVRESWTWNAGISLMAVIDLIILNMGSILAYRKRQMTSTALTELCNCPHCKELRRQQARHGKWQELLLHINKNNERSRNSSWFFFCLWACWIA